MTIIINCTFAKRKIQCSQMHLSIRCAYFFTYLLSSSEYDFAIFVIVIYHSFFVHRNDTKRKKMRPANRHNKSPLITYSGPNQSSELMS